MLGIGRETVYLGYSVNEFERVRKILEEKGIEYRYRIKNPSGQMMVRGTVRSFTGSFGVTPGTERQYEITVKSRVYEEASFYLERHTGMNGKQIAR